MLAVSASGNTPGPTCATMYTEASGAGECPQLIEVNAALQNAAAIDAVYPGTELGGSTPTDKALGTLVDDLLAGPHAGPVSVVLATDGAPNDLCLGGVGGDSSVQQQAVVAASIARRRRGSGRR